MTKFPRETETVPRAKGTVNSIQTGTLNLLMSLSAQVGGLIDLKNTVWTETWDFRARSLTPAAGLSSVASVLWQPGLDSLLFFGWLGAVKPTGSVLGPYVGFAQIETPAPAAPGKVRRITIEARTDSPDLLFEIFVVDKALLELNRRDGKERDYVAPFQATDERTTFSFEASDFRVIARGVDMAHSEQVDLSKLQTIGFQIRKSSQMGGLEKTAEVIPFRLEISRLQAL